MKHSYSPSQRYFTETDRPYPRFPQSLPIIWNIKVAEEFQWEVIATHKDDPSLSASAKVSLHLMPKAIELKGTLRDTHGSDLIVTPPELFRAIARDYDYDKMHKRSFLKTSKPRIAFTILAGSQRGGGSIQVYRYANWLSELGYEVTIYSNDPNVPTWANLRGRYVAITDDRSRYEAIHEEILIVYSVLELPLILQLRRESVQKILHLAQGLEEFHFGADFDENLAPKPIFQLLNTLPVGRIVISSALLDYFRKEYSQESHYIRNGIDSLFTPDSRFIAEFGNGEQPVKILQVASPAQALKGSRILLEAAALLGIKYAKNNMTFHVTFASGPTTTDIFQTMSLPHNVSYSIKSKLSAEELRKEYLMHDVVVNGSFHEGFGLSSLEALACGRCLVQVNNFGLNDVLADGQHALVVPRNNATAMAAAIANLIFNKHLRTLLTSEGPKIASTFTMRDQFSRFVAAWSEILGGVIHDPTLCATIIAQLEHDTPKAPAIEIQEPPRFTVLVPIYNHAHYLPAALDTLRMQSYPYWEAQLVNDGSTDATAEVMAYYAKEDSRFKLHHKQNGGTASALNVGLHNARHEWICWLSSDDFFKRDKLETHARFINTMPEVKFFHSMFSLFQEDKNREETNLVIDTHKYAVPRTLQTLRLFAWNYVHGNTIAVHKSLFDKVGAFNPDYPNAQDFDMWLRMSRHARFQLINKVTCTTRIHAGAGTTQFPQAGIFDSHRSVIALINQYQFLDLIPFVDPANTHELVLALEEVFAIASSPMAFLYQGVSYQQNPFLDRLYEWFISPLCCKGMKNFVVRYLFQYITKLLNEQRTPVEIISNLSRFLNDIDYSFRYTKIDPIKEYMNSYATGLSTDNKPLIAITERYLRKLQTAGVTGAIQANAILATAPTLLQ